MAAVAAFELVILIDNPGFDSDREMIWLNIRSYSSLGNLRVGPLEGAEDK